MNPLLMQRIHCFLPAKTVGMGFAAHLPAGGLASQSRGRTIPAAIRLIVP
jgi:hypothetical protein